LKQHYLHFHVSMGHPVGSTQKRLPRTLLTVCLSKPYHCILSANSCRERGFLNFRNQYFSHTPLWTPQR